MSGLILALFLIALYFVPSIVAEVRHHNNKLAIKVVNFFLGWTVAGWLVALVWSCTDNVTVPKREG
jgi:hypothetical protein